MLPFKGPSVRREFTDPSELVPLRSTGPTLLPLALGITTSDFSPSSSGKLLFPLKCLEPGPYNICIYLGQGAGGGTLEVWKSATSSFHWLNRAQQDCQSPYSLRRWCDLGSLGSLRCGARPGMTGARRFLLPKTDESGKQREKEKKHRGMGRVGRQHSTGMVCFLATGFPCGGREVLPSESFGIVLGRSPLTEMGTGGNWSLKVARPT